MRRFGVLVSALAIAAGCREAPTPPVEPAPAPPPIRVTADRTDLVFSYEDEAGRFQTSPTIAGIPERARGRVVVTDLSRSPRERGASRYVAVADLRAPGPDGTYPVAVMSRFSFGAPAPGDPAAGRSEGVVLYSASWCGVCRRAKAWLSARGVPFVEKDVEASEKARLELLAKAQAAGGSPSGVPVIDVAGTLLFGFDERALAEALAKAGLSPP